MNARRFAKALALLLVNAVAWAQTTSLPLTDDTHIANDAGDWLQADRNYGSRPLMLAHDWGPFYALVRFDAAAISGQTVDSATLLLYLADLRAAGSISVHAITSPWTESSVTWNTGPSFESAAETVIEVGSADVGSVVSIDVTHLVAQWASGALQNNGMLLRTTEPIRAVIDTKETASGVPAELDVMASTGPSVYARVLDFTDPDDCTIDEPGHYVLDRSWDFDDAQSNVACTTLKLCGISWIFDLRGYEITGLPDVPTISGCGPDSNDRVIRNGSVTGSPNAIRWGDNAFVKLENMQVRGDIMAGYATILHSEFLEGTAFLHLCDHTGGCKDTLLVNNRFLDCRNELCLAVGSSPQQIINNNYFEGGIVTDNGDSRITGNTFQLNFEASSAAIHSRYGSDFIAWNVISGTGYTAAAIRIGGTPNYYGKVVVEGNIVRGTGVGIEFMSDGHFYGNNRVSATTPFVGTDSQTDWGGNVIF